MSFVKNIVVRLYFLIYRFGVFLTSSSEGIFVDAKENKIEYTTIFEQYTNLIESFIEQKLKSEIPVSDRIMFWSELFSPAVYFRVSQWKRWSKLFQPDKVGIKSMEYLLLFLDLFSFPQDELGGEVFELLTTLGDFTEFKDLMLSYKQSKTMPSLGLDFAISGKKV